MTDPRETLDPGDPDVTIANPQPATAIEAELASPIEDDRTRQQAMGQATLAAAQTAWTTAHQASLTVEDPQEREIALVEEDRAEVREAEEAAEEAAEAEAEIEAEPVPDPDPTPSEDADGADGGE
jgi:hypothetical protein